MYVEGIGFTITHNELYRGPHTSFSNVACEMLFENNYIHDVCYEAGDAGAIYEGGWTANGNIYRNNLFKDIVNDLSIYYSPNCYYNDDAGGGKTFVSNIIINVDGHGAVSYTHLDVYKRQLLYLLKRTPEMRISPLFTKLIMMKPQ